MTSFRGIGLVLVLVKLLFPTRATTQVVTPGDSITLPTRSAGMQFERNVNTYNWDFHARYGVEDDRWAIRGEDRFQRSLIKSDRDYIRDDQQLLLHAERRFGDFSAVSSFSSFLLTDNKTLGLSDLATHKGHAGLQWRPAQGISLQPFAGYGIDRQQRILDEGILYGAEARLQNIVFDSYLLNAEALYRDEELSPRKQSERNVAAQFQVRFSESARNVTRTFYHKTRRDFYHPVDSALYRSTGIANPIESREEEIFFGWNQLQYELDRRLLLFATIDGTSRHIAKNRPTRDPASNTPVFDSDIDEFRINTAASMRWRFAERGFFELMLEHNERDETHGIRKFEGANDIAFARQQKLEEQKNNNIAQTQLGLSAVIPVGSGDTLAISGSAVKLEYNTPSEGNHDDRDELFFLASLRWSSALTERLLWTLTGDVNLRHTVYIASDRSAANTWNRVIRLSPFIEYRANGFYMKTGGDVVANYTVYDFEMEIPSLQSFSLRQLSVADSTSYAVNEHVWFTLHTLWRFYERGALRWSAFTIQPIAFFEERSLVVSASIRTSIMEASAGVRLFQQNRYRYEGSSRLLDAELLSFGPIGMVEFFLGAGYRVHIDGWYQVLSGSEIETRVTPSISMNVNWLL